MTVLDRSWLDRAACIDTPVDVFFPTDKTDAVPAKQVCGRCPVVDECLRYAVEAGETQGVWGGKTPRQRSLWAGRQGLVRHGTLVGYQDDGCRCDRCRTAYVDYQSARRGTTRREHVAPCGTAAAHRRHLRKGEKPCQACREAKAAYEAQRAEGAA